MDKYVNELRKMNDTFTYEKMKNEESPLNDDERTINDVRTHDDEESQAPKRRKGMPGESQAKGKEVVNQESRQKKHKSDTPLSTMSSSSMRENNIAKKDDVSKHGFNMESYQRITISYKL